VISIDKHISQGGFESLYLQLREKEGRIYSDNEVAALPEIAKTHPHYAEWQLRKQSCERLISYLQKKKKPLKILEAGCGNGWLSHRLAAIPGSNVIGADINFTEIKQAAKVFQKISDLHFVYGQIDSGTFEEKQFDIVVFAASIQYFPSLSGLISQTMKLLKQGGEIHILDSHFYRPAELNAARHRSLLYYEATGFPEMMKWYFHHSTDEIEKYDFSLLYDPESLFNRFLKKKNPFPWIRIR
jgi:ubiquinone/menaquinone biosynthesis C-methylase UbiE